ncbi:ABC transporter ATP-binding protein [Amycolatopsis thermophila]|uniref:ABC transporter ATP-binding protein n=1 Tax=Amycolatopsis thermophila TaxID=206084 RepID=UPI0027D81C3F|nr:ATP-binding cassette domain-containing protein [Amycolatopsis thermophila]
MRGLTAGYGHAPVVEGLDLSVASGEIVSVLGRNGAGKSTTLMAISGVLPRAKGAITVDGRVLSGPPHKRSRSDLGLVLEGRSVFAKLSVAQNLKIAGVSADEVTEIFPELGKRIGVPAGMLSGGEQQMLSLARAICRRPKALLLDELSFGLAPVVCDRLFETIRDFARTSNVAVLLVEQHIAYAADVADRALVMSEGRIGLELPGAELREREEEVEALYLGGPGATPADQVAAEG